MKDKNSTLVKIKLNSCLLLLKATAVVILIAGNFINAFSQPTFLRMYNKGNSGYTVREVNGNTYVSAGGTDFYFNWHFVNMSPIANTNIHFFKTDNAGNLLWEKIYNRLGYRIIARWFEPTLDGGYILTGFENHDVTWQPDSNNIILIKTDGNGAITWSKSFDTGKDELAFCVRQTSDGGYIVSGFHDAVPVSIVGNTYSILIKTDGNGAVQWVKKYQFAVRDLATGEPMVFVVRQTADDGYVVVGTTASAHAADLNVLRVDVNGNLLWAHSFDHDISAFRFSVGLDIIESASGDFVIAGAMDKNRMLSQYNYPYILKISSAGAFISAKFFETNPVMPFQSGFSSVEQTPDGGFFFTGMGGYSGFGDQAQMLKTDVNFNMLWSRVYSMDGNATMGTRSGRLTSDGGYVFTGKRQFSGTVLLKTNNIGLIPCKNPGVLVEYLPGIAVQNWNPVIQSGINSNDIILSTQSPLVDTTTLCPLNFTLPVELTYFSAVPLPGKQVQADWTTASEINNDYFLIEKSADGMHFEEAGRIKGAGHSASVLNYSFTDKHPYDSKIIYYRLRQVDYNGQEDFSKVVPVSFSNNNIECIRNETDHNRQEIKIYINAASAENMQYKLTDIPGKIISQGSQALPKGISSITVDAKNLSQGIYYFLITNGKNTSTIKIFY